MAESFLITLIDTFLLLSKTIKSAITTIFCAVGRINFHRRFFNPQHWKFFAGETIKKTWKEFILYTHNK